MTHFTNEQWDRFGKGMLAPAIERKMENHLLTCEQCRISFENSSLQYEPPLEFTVEEAVMNAIVAIPTEILPINKPSSRMRKKTLTHFFISAAAAVMLASTGVFTSLVDETSNVQEEELKDAPSITASLLERTERLFTQMDPSTKEELK